MQSEIETFALLFIDTDENNSYLYLDLRKKLSHIIDSFESFQQVEVCERYIQESVSKCHHVIIVGEELAREFIPRIHDLPQIFTIYIYINSNEHNMQCLSWIKDYSKVCSFFFK